MRHVICLLVCLAACDRHVAEDLTPRGGTVDPPEGTGEPPSYPETECRKLLPPPDDTTECACDPDAPDCADGLDCVPSPAGHRCLAPCTGQTITRCESACFYPLAGPAGTGPGYCPACLDCAPPLPDTFICQ